MNVEQYFSKLHNLERSQKRIGEFSLEGMKWLMNEFDHPQEKVKMIHIAGTNGKGSICEMLNSIFLNTNYSVGKYMSPHLIKINERITVNNEMITDFEIEELLEKLDVKIQEYNQTHETKITWFETMTCLAFLYFEKKKCDLAIIETGLGGLLDSTNIIDPLVSVITTIGYDHTHILGNTLEQIAEQKAGIIKPNRDTVFFNQPEVNHIIQKNCEKKNNTLHLVREEEITQITYEPEFSIFNYQSYDKLMVNLKGNRQITNACLCLEALTILQKKGFNITEQAIRNGLKTVVHKGRFEVLGKEPKIIFDGGHNENAISNLRETIKQQYSSQKKVYIFSILKTKDYQNVIKQLLADEDSIVMVTSGSQGLNYVEKETLYSEAKQYRKEHLYAFELTEAIQFAQKNYSDSIIFVIGSFYIYKEVVDILAKK